MKALILFLAFVTLSWALPPPSPVLDVPGLGKMQGSSGYSYFQKRTYYMYKGIRYGISPSGERRFQASELAGGWNGTLDAKSFGQKCPQTGIYRKERRYGGWEEFETRMEEEMIRTGEIEPDWNRDNKEKEDCLFVHVYTTKLGVEHKMPVMVFFHGGAFSGGSALVYGAQRLMDKDVVLVVPHYRLGPLGFLSLQTDDVPGNAGLLDQVLALKWVQKYISYFGGDPNLVTIFGESAGGASVSYLMLSPLAKGLFHRVIGQSGSSLADWAIDLTPEYHTVNIAAEAGCNVTGADGGKGDLTEVTKCLKTIDAMKLTQAYQYYRLKEEKIGHSGFGGCSPIIQRAGRVKYVEKHPLEILKSGDYSNVPIMFGSNKHEGTYVMAIVYSGYMVANNLVEDEYFLTYEVPDHALKLLYLKDPNYWLVDSIINKYIKSETVGNFTNMTPGIIDFLGSIFLKGPTYHKVQLNSRVNNSYYYAFNYRGKNTMWDFIGDPNAPFDGGVCHANDLLYLFNVPLMFLDEEGEEVSRKMVGLWTNFAYYGEPNPEKSRVDGVPEWPSYNSNNEFYMRFDKNFMGKRDFTKEYTIALDESTSTNKL